jgi:hypothetical protein
MQHVNETTISAFFCTKHIEFYTIGLMTGWKARSLNIEYLAFHHFRVSNIDGPCLCELGGVFHEVPRMVLKGRE